MKQTRPSDLKRLEIKTCQSVLLSNNMKAALSFFFLSNKLLEDQIKELGRRHLGKLLITNSEMQS